MRASITGSNLHFLRSGQSLIAVFLCLCLLLAGCRGGRGSAGPGADNPQSSSGRAGQAEPGTPAADSGSPDAEKEEEAEASGEAAAGTGPVHEAAAGSASAFPAGESAAAGAGESSSASSTGESAAAGDSASASAAMESAGSASAVPASSTGRTRGKADGFSAEGKDLLIVLDPGHSSAVPGTEDPIGPGASEMKESDTEGTYGPASALYEYELTMRVSQKLRAELEERGYIVRLTHLDTVNPISCVDRARVANDNDADAFIRIHANSAEDTSVNGAMTICISEDNPYHPELYSASSRLSEILLDTYCEQTGARREKVWETDTMTGNNWSEVPASMIELGYMSNPDEDLMMAMDSYQKKMVNAIADGLDKWFEEMPAGELSMHPTLNGQARPETEEGPDQTLPDGSAPAAVSGTEEDGSVTEGSEDTASTQQEETSENGVPLTVGGEAEDSAGGDAEFTVQEGSDDGAEGTASSEDVIEDETEDTDADGSSQTGEEADSTDQGSENEESEEEALPEPQPGGVPFR